MHERWLDMHKQDENKPEIATHVQEQFKWLPIMKDLEMFERLGLFQGLELHNASSDQRYITSNNTVEAQPKV